MILPLRKGCACGGGCSSCGSRREDEDDALSAVRRKTAIGALDDPLEREADRVADRVIRGPACPCGGGCSRCGGEQGGGVPQIVRRAPAAPAATDPRLPDAVRSGLRAPARPLDRNTRRLLEARLGQDLADVRIHTGPDAAASARAINAIAFTLGRDIVFGNGRYAPDTTDGLHLIAHEVTHVIQQRNGAMPAIRRAPLCNPPKAAMPGKAEFATDPRLVDIRDAAFRRTYRTDLPLQGGDDDDPAIGLVQRLLLNIVCDGIDRDLLATEFTDGFYGPETVRAARRFQTTHADPIGQPLARDGAVGPITLAAMDVALGLPPQGPARPPRDHGDCHGIARDGPGETFTHPDPATGATRWVLSNFDIDRHFVKEEHRLFLENTVVPAIRGRTPVDDYLLSVVGEASTTASWDHNVALSWRREHCAVAALREAGLEPTRRIDFEAGIGEQQGDLEQIARGESPFAEHEDRTRRLVTITLARKEDPCDRKAAVRDFIAYVACDSPTSVRITLATADSVHAIYRDFGWYHEPWPTGCTLITGSPPDFPAHAEWVQAAVPMRLARRDPDEWTGPSDFDGDAAFVGHGANQYLIHLFGALPAPLFRIGLGGRWQDDICDDSPQYVQGYIKPIGPVRCGLPSMPAAQCSFPPPDACSDDHRKASSKRFNGIMFGGSLSVNRGPDWLRQFITPGVAVVGVHLGTRDASVDPPLARRFVFVGGGISGGGKGIDQLKLAFAKDQDADGPSRLAHGSGMLSRSDFDRSLLAKLVFVGGTNRIELTTDAGRFTFLNPICNDATRTYRGAFQPVLPVECPGSLGVPDIGERKCEDDRDCPESARLAGHRKFTVKIGRATLATLPAIGRGLAERHGCRFSAAFVHIQSEDGDEKARIHREFLVVLGAKDCAFTVAKEMRSLEVLIPRRLAISDPDEIFAPSDFIGAARLDERGRLTLASFTTWPIGFALPGTFDPKCTRARGGLGVAVPIAAVDCGETPDPLHDATIVPSHVDQCTEFARQNPWVHDVVADLRSGRYDELFKTTGPGELAIPPDLYYNYLAAPGTVQRNVLFVGWKADPATGRRVRMIALADLRILNVYPSQNMDVEFLSDLCAFDENGAVVFVSQDACIERIGRTGDVARVSPRTVSREKKPQQIRG